MDNNIPNSEIDFQRKDIQTIASREKRELVERFTKGDTDAFRAIYMQWYDPIRYMLNRLTRNEHDAEDIAQDVFSTLWLQRSSVDPSREIKAYIVTLAKRAAIKHVRRLKIKNDYLSSDFSFDECDDNQELFIARETKLLVDCVIAGMPAQRREAYLLSLNEGLGPSEIAERLDISPKSASNFIYQARRDIKDALAISLLFWTVIH